ncbi:CsbD family protein [Planctomyces bekefii]|uniref:CsbD family protein n=1 Tax=Planctomyces bekefii TaxID=1653850 RepID=A0A5C6M4U7_9PLAN|nr:CsbD family protein [Planctomyces bekefii]
MNWDQIEGQWKDLKGRMRERWAKLTEDDLEWISGKRDRLLGKVQKHYGMQKEKAEKEVDSFVTSIDRQLKKH